MHKFFVHDLTRVDFLLEYWAYQVYLHGRLMPDGRELAARLLIVDEGKAKAFRPPAVITYWVPYAKSPRHQIHWKQAHAPVVSLVQ